MSPHLSAFRIPDTAEVLYRRVLRSATMGVAAHAAELGWTVAETMVALQSLIATRLVRLTGDGQVLVEDPRLALERLIDGEEAKLESRRRTLAEARGAINQFSAERRLGQADVVNGVRRTAWEVVVADVAPGLVAAPDPQHPGPSAAPSSPSARGPGVDPEARRATRRPRGRPGAPRALPLRRPGRPGRAYEWMQAWAAIGRAAADGGLAAERVRRLRPDAVMAAGVWGAAEGDYVIIRDLMLVEAFTALFDLAWSAGLPVPDARRPASPTGGCWRCCRGGTRTRRSRGTSAGGCAPCGGGCPALMDALGADTRFQLGSPPSSGACSRWRGSRR